MLRPRTSGADVSTPEKQLSDSLTSTGNDRGRKVRCWRVFLFLFSARPWAIKLPPRPGAARTHTGGSFGGVVTALVRAPMQISPQPAPRRLQGLSFSVSRKHTHIHTRDGLSPLLVPSFLPFSPIFAPLTPFFKRVTCQGKHSAWPLVRGLF